MRCSQEMTLQPRELCCSTRKTIMMRHPIKVVADSSRHDVARIMVRDSHISNLRLWTGIAASLLSEPALALPMEQTYSRYFSPRAIHQNTMTRKSEMSRQGLYGAVWTRWHKITGSNISDLESQRLTLEFLLELRWKHRTIEASYGELAMIMTEVV